MGTSEYKKLYGLRNAYTGKLILYYWSSSQKHKAIFSTREKAGQAAEYIRFVATMRHNQRRYFATRNTDVLELSKRMEKELDELNSRLLDPQPKLF